MKMICTNYVFGRNHGPIGGPCGAKATRVRRVGDYDKPFCAECDPVRKDEERKNQKQRKANKKNRWKQLEAARR